MVLEQEQRECVDLEEHQCIDLEEHLLNLEHKYRCAFQRFAGDGYYLSALNHIRSELDAGWAEYHELSHRLISEGDRELRGLLSDLEWELARVDSVQLRA